MDTPSRGFPRGDIRVSDAERDQAVAELSEHFQAGRLTREEFEERSGRALQARKGNDLGALFTDLPSRITAPPPQAGGRAASPAPNPCGLCPAGHLSIARAVIACVIVTTIVGNLLGDAGPGNGAHGGIGWVVPVVILGFLYFRVGRRR